ncbi:MAG TPA: AAA family ATPase [Nitrolancea sp.]|nr:AAA family ATPase [Nitrolancea sp.]
MGKPTLYILTGISFAGKSVLARELSAFLDIPRLDPDEVSNEYGWGRDGEFLSDEQWALVHGETERRASWLLIAGQSVVYDTTAFTYEQRTALRQLAIDSGADACVIFVNTPRAIAYERWGLNEVCSTRSRVHPSDFAMVADLFEPPVDEPHLRYDSGDDVKTWIASHFAVERANREHR